MSKPNDYGPIKKLAGKRKFFKLITTRFIVILQFLQEDPLSYFIVIPNLHCKSYLQLKLNDRLPSN